MVLGEPLASGPPAQHDFDDYRHKWAKGVAAVARFTGHGLSEEQLDWIVNADVAFRVADS